MTPAARISTLGPLRTALAASALLLALAIVGVLALRAAPAPTPSGPGLLLGQLVGGGARTGGMAAASGSLVALTADAGTEDILLVLDNRTEELLVYNVPNPTTVQLLQRLNLAQLFTQARARSLGRPSP